MTHQQKLREHYQQQVSQSESPDLGTMVQDKFLQRVYALLDNHLDNPQLGVEWLSEQLGMNRKTFYRKTQSLTQLVTNELIRRYRLRKPTDLLRLGYTVSETAYRVGFKAPNYFSECFKEVYQLTPSEFIAKASIARIAHGMPQN